MNKQGYLREETLKLLLEDLGSDTSGVCDAVLNISIDLKNRGDYVVSNNRLVFGWGVNDISKEDQDNLPDYSEISQRWKEVIRRCYYNSGKDPYYYENVGIDPEWRYLSDFYGWVVNQDWDGKVLDKDLLSDGSSIYSPETCEFILPKTNGFLVTRPHKHYKQPIGVRERNGKYEARISHTLGDCRGRKHLGVFDTPEEAYEAWKKAKQEVALVLAEIETDPRVKDKLRVKYL